MSDEQKTVVAVSENADGTLKPIDEIIVIESTGSKAWRLTKHETAFLLSKWWPVAILGLCDILTAQANEMQTSQAGWAVRCGVLLMGIISIARVWATNNRNKVAQ